MRFRELTHHPHDEPHARKLFSERGLWELIVERDRAGLHLDLWWSRWPYGRIVGYCVSAHPGGEEEVVAALVRALDAVPEDARGWDVELYLPPPELAPRLADPSFLDALPRPIHATELES